MQHSPSGVVLRDSWPAAVSNAKILPTTCPRENAVAIHELNDEQIHSWTLEQKDRWWLETVFRGDMPQLTIRSALTGMGLGAILSLTNITSAPKPAGRWGSELPR